MNVGFTKLAVSPLIMVRFEKFEILHTHDSDPDPLDVMRIGMLEQGLP